MHRPPTTVLAATLAPTTGMALPACCALPGIRTVESGERLIAQGRPVAEAVERHDGALAEGDAQTVCATLAPAYRRRLLADPL